MYEQQQYTEKSACLVENIPMRASRQQLINDELARQVAAAKE